MNKLLYTSALCAFSVLMGVNAAKAVDFPQHYRTLDVNASYNDKSTNFATKHIFPFHFPKDLPGTPVFKGAKGQFSTTTEASYNESGQENTYSETLFGIEFSTNKCPSDAGATTSSMDNAFGVGNHYGLFGNIVKQTQGGPLDAGLTKVSSFDFMNPYDIVMNMGENGCGIVYFDGTDFKNKSYTRATNFQLKYTFQPIKVQLDGEFIIDVDTYAKTARHNAQVVIPVVSGPGKGQGQIRPGTIFAVNGNTSTAGNSVNNKGDWSVRYVTAVLKRNSCQVELKNGIVGQDTSKKFQTQGVAGIGDAPNPAAVLGAGSTIISDFTVFGNGRDSVMGNAHGNNNLPVHVEDGDCVVQAALPYGKSSTATGTNVNVEMQTNVAYIPD